jgi:hypothetical protein
LTPGAIKVKKTNGFPITYGKSLATRTSYVPPLIKTFLGHFHVLQNEVLIMRVDCKPFLNRNIPQNGYFDRATKPVSS